jgi:hypothetical protein
MGLLAVSATGAAEYADCSGISVFFTEYRRHSPSDAEEEIRSSGPGAL